MDAPLPAAPTTATAAGVALAPAASAYRSSAIRDLLRLTERPDILSLAGGLPAEDAIPAHRIGAAGEAVLARHGSAALQYGPTAGLAELRAWIAEHLTGRTGRRHVPEQVLVVTGSQQAFDLLTKVLVGPGDLVAVEDPCYVGALQALRGASPRLLAVPSDGDGMRTTDLAAGPAPKLAYTVPSFGNPTGATLSPERRVELAELAERRGFLLIEDGPYDELAFDGPPPAPVAAHTDRVVGVGTFSKTLAPGLRVGWVAAPLDLVPHLERVKQAADLHTATFAQRIVLDVVTDTAWYGPHLDRVRDLYRQRRDALLAALSTHLADQLEVGRPSGGMFVWCRAAGGPDAEALLPVAVEHGVAFVPGSAFAVAQDLSRHLRLSFATVAPDGFDEAARRLSAAFAALGAGARS